jgi:hypothetical protein
VARDIRKLRKISPMPVLKMENWNSKFRHLPIKNDQPSIQFLVDSTLDVLLNH